jgi:hypothetical protein
MEESVLECVVENYKMSYHCRLPFRDLLITLVNNRLYPIMRGIPPTEA